MKSVFFLAAGVALAVLLLMGIFGKTLEPKGAAPKVEVSGEVMKLNGIRLTQKKNNAREIDLWAETAAISLDESRIDLEKFTIVSHSKKTGQVTLSAQKGVFFNATSDVTAEGGTLVRDGSGRALMTDSLKWINAKREIRTDDPIWVFGDGFVLRGKGLIARLKEENVEILSEVNVVISPSRRQ